MGYPMAGHLARAGHEVTVFNRSTARAEAWQSEYGGHVAPIPAAAAKDQDAVMLCVGNDDDVREVTTGVHGALTSMSEGALLIDHTTTSEALGCRGDSTSWDPAGVPHSTSKVQVDVGSRGQTHSVFGVVCLHVTSQIAGRRPNKVSP